MIIEHPQGEFFDSRLGIAHTTHDGLDRAEITSRRPTAVKDDVHAWYEFLHDSKACEDHAEEVIVAGQRGELWDDYSNGHHILQSPSAGQQFTADSRFLLGMRRFGARAVRGAAHSGPRHWDRPSGLEGRSCTEFGKRPRTLQRVAMP